VASLLLTLDLLLTMSQAGVTLLTADTLVIAEL
jgi:hypothetical protein